MRSVARIINDARQYFSKKKSQQRDDRGRREVQELDIDWIELGIEATANGEYLDFTSIDPSEYFQVGDKLRLKESGGSYKYFYVISTESARVRITAGTDYNITTGNTITNIAYSRLMNPTSFPATSNYEPNFRSPGGSLAQAPITESYKFWMVGAIAYVDLHFDNDSMSGVESSIVCELPTPYSTDADVPLYACLGVNNFTPQTAIAKIGSSPSSFDVEINLINDSGFTNWVASTNGTGVDVTFGYLVQ